jgi:putative acyl-CoA dehydrogenase
VASFAGMSLVTPRRGTHEVLNQTPPLAGYNPFDADVALQEALAREGGGWGAERARALAAILGSEEAEAHSLRARTNLPVLHTHDRFGHRIDEVEYDPSMHWMLRLGVEHGLPSLPWREPRPGAHVARAALHFLFNGLDTGPTCPFAINYAGIPTLRQDPALAAEYETRLASPDYTTYLQAGMVMTEKQGGSDLRANTTVAEPVGDGWYELTGHKWFCTHPIFGVFFTLAEAPGGMTCFVAERVGGDGCFRIQRLKDKLGGRCLASSEVEYERLPARPLGDEGRGIKVMVEQLTWTRLDTLVAVAGMMRRPLAEAIHHARHRQAFGAALADKPAMLNVLADLALESEAATAAAFRLVRAYETDTELPLRRFGTAVLKYWISKRGPGFNAEALECLGGNGYIEEAPMARFYRDVLIGTVWEGSGNVAALDVLRALAHDPDGLPAYLAECELARGADLRLDAELDALPGAVAAHADEWHARGLVERLAVAFQASVLLRSAPPYVASAFCASRLGGGSGRTYGTLPAGIDARAIVDRALA